MATRSRAPESLKGKVFARKVHPMARSTTEERGPKRDTTPAVPNPRQFQKPTRPEPTKENVVSYKHDTEHFDIWDPDSVWMVKKDESITGRDVYPYASMHTILWRIIHMDA